MGEIKDNSTSQIYSNFQICEKLKANEKCFRVRLYNDGKFVEIFHEHVPKHRISSNNSLGAMRSLIARYSQWEASYILRSYLNERGEKPPATQSFRVVIDYPEPGVFRKYCCSDDINVWVDEVVGPEVFRRTEDRE